MKLSCEEYADYVRFCEGGEIPDNAKGSIRPALYMLRFLTRRRVFGWQSVSTIGFFFVLGRLLYEHHREEVRPPIPQEKQQKTEKKLVNRIELPIWQYPDRLSRERE